MMVGWGYFARTFDLAERLRQEVVIPRHHEKVPSGDLILQFGLLPLAGTLCANMSETTQLGKLVYNADS